MSPNLLLHCCSYSNATLALQGDRRRFPFPVPMQKRKDCDFSFSGLKTAVLYTTHKYVRACSCLLCLSPLSVGSPTALPTAGHHRGAQVGHVRPAGQG